jgi:hypothetical protein
MVAAVTLSVPFALAALVGAPAGASPATYTAAPFSEATPTDVIILADESGSIGSRRYPGELPGERQAAAEIASAAWSADSRVAIYGFGSAPPGEPESAAVDKICGPTPVATQQDIAILDACASRIAARPPDAWNTDFDAALTVAGQVLTAEGTAGQGRVPLVFMLTDGTLDLGSAFATSAAQRQLSGVVLRGLDQRGIEIWPVGFGAADRGALDAIAGGGAQTIRTCPAGSGGAPRATTVRPSVTGTKETEQIQQQLLRAFAAASCATAGPGHWQVLQPGKSVTQYVAVDPLTTLGSIIVNKGDRAVTVTYTDRDGGHVADTARATGQLDGAAYQLSSSGAAATQEALHLDYPVPGRWAVTFDNHSGQPQVVSTQVLWQGQVDLNVNFSPETGDSDSRKQLLVMVRPLTVRPIPAAELALLHVRVTVQWRAGGTTVAVPVTFSPADGEFTGPVTVPFGQSGNALVTATVQAAGVVGAGQATLSYQPGGGLRITVSIPPDIRIDTGSTRTFDASVTNLDNTKQPDNHSVHFLLSGLHGTGNAWIIQPGATIGSGTGSVPVTIHVGQARGLVQGEIEWEVAGTQYPAGPLDITVGPPPPWYTQWWPWTALAVVVLAGAGLYTRRRVKADRARRAGEAAARAEAEQRAANKNVRDAGLALLRRDVPGDVAFLRWTGPDDDKADIFERWFEVRRTTSGIPRLLETTHKKSGRVLLLTRSAEDGMFRLTAPGIAVPAPADGTGNGTRAAASGAGGPVQLGRGPGGTGAGAGDAAAVADVAQGSAAAGGPGAAPVAAAPAIREDRPFDPPPGTGLDDCVFMVTRDDAPRAKLPDPRLDDQDNEDYVPVPQSTGSSWRDEEFERPDPTEYDDFSDFDEHGDAGGSTPNGSRDLRQGRT